MKNLKNSRIQVMCLVGITLGSTQVATAYTASASDGKEIIKPVFGGFIDTYWGYSTANPSSIDRQYTTQAVRNNEFNINLAFIEAKVESDKVRGRLALQAGTSVQSNYSGEPTIGAISGPSLSHNIQEAYAGYD